MSNIASIMEPDRFTTHGTLTDIELLGLASLNSLADGHAYHDIESFYAPVIEALPTLWSEAAKHSIPDMEHRYKCAFSTLIRSTALERIANFKICPTASNSIDIIGAFLRARGHRTALVEPTFDNLALLLRRRQVDLFALSDDNFQRAAETDRLDAIKELCQCRALLLVIPNNPTGYVFSESAFENIVRFCERHRMTLLLDNSFRLFKRHPYDDYAVLINSGISFISFEDTGKAFPTQDMKASLLTFSEDNRLLVEEIYNEIYLCVSNYALNILAAFMEVTYTIGLDLALWRLVDERRAKLRAAIEGSKIRVSGSAIDSRLGVEWLDCGAVGSDEIVCSDLQLRGLVILPGRNFYWNSPMTPSHQTNIRVSLLKPRQTFEASVSIIEAYCARD